MEIVIFILAAILFSAYFSGMEIAFVASNRLRIELDKKQGLSGSAITSMFARNPGQFISSMLVGNNIALVVFGLLFARLIANPLMAVTESDVAILLIQTVASTIVVLIFAEFLPKLLFMMSPNFFLRGLSLPTALFYYLFYPFSRLNLTIANRLITIFSGSRAGLTHNEDQVFSRAELNHFVDLIEDGSEKDENGRSDIQIFRNALEFANVKLRECMVPRTEIEALDINSDLADLKQKFTETGHSKILIYENSIDNIIGYFEFKDLFKKPAKIGDHLRKLAIVPETMPANKLLSSFVDEKKSIALVVDEFGGTSGMVTIEDVLEEIVGDIEDEHDYYDFTEKMTANGEYLFSGRLDIDYLNEKYGLDLPERDDYETLAGLILYEHGSIPGVNEIIQTGSNISIRVVKATDTRIELVSLKSDTSEDPL